MQHAETQSLTLSECCQPESAALVKSAVASNVLLNVFLIGTLLLFVLCHRRPGLREKLRQWLFPQASPDDSLSPHRPRDYWFWGGLFFVLVALVGLEVSQPYYFTQDDVLVGELPGVLWLCQSVWQGVVPEYNPCVLLGAPALSCGGGTYPVTYVAYAIARHGLGNEYATIEVFAFLHILAGYAATYWAARQVGIGRMPALVVSVCFVLSGSVLIMGRSWHTFVPAVVWTPLLIVAAAKLARGPVGWKWTLATGVIVGVAFHGEFPQIWAYSVGFFVFAILWFVVLGKIPAARGLHLLPALMLGLAIAIPLLAVQMGLASELKRPSGYGAGIGDGTLAMLVPYPMVWAPHPNGWGSTDIQYMGHLYYFGTLLALLCAANVVLLLATLPNRRTWAEHAWTVCAGLAFLAALGREGYLWSLMTEAPVLGAINNNPFRMLPFFVLFAALSGGLLLERLLQYVGNRRAWELALSGLLVVVIAYHVALCRPAFYTYGFRPYPAMSNEMARLLWSAEGSPTGRITSWAAKRSISPSFADALPLNLPMVYQLPAFGGYSPLIECMPPYLHAKKQLGEDPTAAARAYGLRWFLKHRSCSAPVFSPNPAAVDFEAKVKLDEDFQRIGFAKTHALAGAPELKVLELDDVDPLAFVADKSKRALPVHYNGAGIDVDVRGLTAAAPVIVNFLQYPKMTATIDGREVECRRDAWHRILVDVPAGAHRLAIRYRPDWKKGVRLGLELAAISVAITFFSDRLSRRYRSSRS